jgi:glycosyltransferase involved in cell wall biosynthesis
MNEDSRHLLSRLRSRRVIVEPHVAIDTASLPPLKPKPREPRLAVFAGRLVPWKAVSLAIRALTIAPDWHLRICGDGPEFKRLQRLAHRLGVEARTHFEGRVPRTQVLAVLSSADVFLFPSLHDSNSWAVAEAVSMGLPVVCLNIGGPPLLAGQLGVPIATNRMVVRNLGLALQNLPEREPTDVRWGAQRLPGILHDWYESVQATELSS